VVCRDGMRQNRLVQNRRRFRIATVTIALLSVATAIPAGAVPTGGALVPQLELDIPVAGLYGVPADARGVAVNVTVTSPSAPGFLAAYPCGSKPNTSNVNYSADQTVPNLVISALSRNGHLCISTSAMTDVIVDLSGFIPNQSHLVALARPERFLDTRVDIGAIGKAAAGTITEVQVAGNGGVPASAGLVAFNATAVESDRDGYVTVFPCGQPVPRTSSLNFRAGTTVPNLVLTRVGDGGKICFFTNAAVHLLGDVAAYLPTGDTGLSMLSSPDRVLDTRSDPNGRKTSVAGHQILIAGRYGVPATAESVVLNVTAVNARLAGYAVVYPCSATAPTVSNVNFVESDAVANAAVVKVSSVGTVCLKANVETDLIVDISGYGANTSAFVPLTPLRISDTRDGAEPYCNRAARPTFVNGASKVEIVNLTTGATESLGDLPAGSAASATVYMSRDCSSIFVALSFGVGSPVVTFDRSGHAVRTGSLATSWPLAASSNRLLGVHPGGVQPAIVDALSGESVVNLPPLGIIFVNRQPQRSIYQFIGASADETVFAVSEPMSDITSTVFHDRITFVDRSGSTLATWDAPPDSIGYRLSGDGRYLAYTADRQTATPVVRVIALNGTLVASVPNRTTAPTTTGPAGGWMSDATLWLCSGLDSSGTTRLERWDVGSGLRTLIADAGNRCVQDAT
jgi:hypothetical protein